MARYFSKPENADLTVVERQALGLSCSLRVSVGDAPGNWLLACHFPLSQSVSSPKCYGVM